MYVYFVNKIVSVKMLNIKNILCNTNGQYCKGPLLLLKKNICLY